MTQRKGVIASDQTSQVSYQVLWKKPAGRKREAKEQLWEPRSGSEPCQLLLLLLLVYALGLGLIHNPAACGGVMQGGVTVQGPSRGPHYPDLLLPWPWLSQISGGWTPVGSWLGCQGSLGGSLRPASSPVILQAAPPLSQLRAPGQPRSIQGGRPCLLLWGNCPSPTLNTQKGRKWEGEGVQTSLGHVHSVHSFLPWSIYERQ